MSPDFREFDEIDMIENDSKKSRMQSGSTMQSGRKKSTPAALRIPDSISALEVQSNVRTLITHNKGATWEPLRAPSVTSKGAPIDCHIEDDCSLNLEIYSHNNELAPVYSSESAIGIVLGTGNLGARLSEEHDQKNLYLSRDGGMTWRSIRPGGYIYEIGDHGALIVIAKHQEAVKGIEFS